MKIETFILGAITGIVFSDEKNRRLFKNLANDGVKGASSLIDMLNSKGGHNVPTSDSEIPTPTE